MPPETVLDRSQWNATLTDLPGGHLLQSWEWGELKSKYGWRAHRLAWRDNAGTPLAAAQILHRNLPIPVLSNRVSLLYCPRGPALDWSDSALSSQVLEDLRHFTQIFGAMFLKIDPDLALAYAASGEGQDSLDDPAGKSTATALQEMGWRPSAEQIQFRNTFLLDLDKSEEGLLAEMKQKTRYNIRLAARRGVQVRLADADDFDLLYRMYAETSVRDGFAIRKAAYYHDAWGSFIRAGLAQPFIALVDQTPVAAVIVFRFGHSALYMYGMSSDQHREKMPNHLLQWEAIRWAKQRGCKTYDFWGAPDSLDPNDPLWGLYRFKSGFGARFVRTVGAWDYATKPVLYWLYAVAKPQILKLMRVRGKRQTRQTLDL